MKSIKARLFTLGGGLCAALAMALAAALSPRPAALQPADPSASAPAPQAPALPTENIQPVEQAVYRYVARDYNGKIAIYPSAQAVQPQYVTDFDTASLPQRDRELLQQGIGLRDEQELQMLLEDYGS